MPYSRQKTVVYTGGGTGQPYVQAFTQRFWNVQRRPWVNPLEFMSIGASYLHSTGYYYDDATTQHPRDPIDVYNWLPSSDVASADVSRAINKAYESFVAKMKDSAQNANNLLEVNQNVTAVVNHVKALTKAATALHKGDLGGAASALGLTLSGAQEKRIRKRAKQGADMWLELHFGWVPLVQDIGSSIDAIQGTGKASKQGTRITSNASANGSYYVDLSESNSSGHDVTRYQVGVRMSALAQVSNPNLALANQMGFVNPLSVVWEAVPFSFVVDWFSNVGQCLGAMTDMVGFNITHARTTVLTQFTREFVKYTNANIGWQQAQFSAIGTKSYNCTRTTGITGPVLEPTPFKGFGIARGATAISLLVQQLSKL